MKIKKILSVILSVIMILSVSPVEWFSFKVSAVTDSNGDCGTGVTWHFTAETGELLIKGNGTMLNWTKGKAPWYDLQEYIYSIVIDNGIKNVGSYAFEGCAANSVSIPVTVTSIGDHAFEGCAYFESVDIPTGVTYLGEAVFSGCAALKEIAIPDGVTRIPSSLFYRCTSLNTADLGSNISEIGTNAFHRCSSLQEIIGEENASLIGSGAFQYCSSLESIDLSDKITYIEDNAFIECQKLSSITIPKNVSYIGRSAFYNCVSLQKFVVDENNEFYSTDDHGVLYDKNKTTLVCYPIGNEMTNYTVPGTVTVVDAYAFANCKFIEEISFSGEVIDLVDYSAFEGCIALKKVDIECGVRSIGSRAFYGCSELATVILSNALDSITANAFSSCASLSEIYFIGTEDEWASVKIGRQDSSFYAATVYCISHFHSYEEELFEPTCTENGCVLHTCSICGDSYKTDEVEALDHDFSKWTLAKEPTTREEGYETRTCSRCGLIETQSIEKIPMPLLVVSKEQAVAGETVEVKVSVENNLGIIAAHLSVRYNSEYLTLIEVRDGTLLGDSTTMVAGRDFSAMPYSVVFYDSLAEENHTGNGVLVTFVFKISSDAPSVTTAVTLDYYADSTFNKDLDNVEFDVKNGSIEIESIPDKNSISVYKMPDKTVYEIGEMLDITGLSLKFSYADGSFEIIESGIEFKKVVFEGSGKHTVTVSYGGYTTSFEVTVIKAVNRLEIFSLDGSLDKKINWWKRYSTATMSLDYNLYNCKEAVRFEWKSSNTRVKIDQNGNITNTGSFARSSKITLTAYDANGNIVTQTSVRVRFYKFNWQTKYLKTQDLTSDFILTAAQGVPNENDEEAEVITSIFGILTDVLINMLYANRV